MSSSRGWAPTGESSNELHGPESAAAAAAESSTINMNSSSATIHDTVPQGFVPPHPPRPLRKMAALSSPSRLDEAIAAQAAVAATAYATASIASTTASAAIAAAVGDDEKAAAAAAHAAASRSSPLHRNSAVRSGSTSPSNTSGVNLLAVAANRRCDAFLEKIRMTSEKSSEAARMSDTAFATARQAVDVHSPSRGGGAPHDFSSASLSSSGGPLSSPAAAAAATPSKFSARIALAQQRSAHAAAAHLAQEAPCWNLKKKQGQEGENNEQDASVNSNKAFCVTGQTHVAALLGIETTGKSSSSAIAVSASPRAVTISGNSSADPTDPAAVTALLEAPVARCTVDATEKTLAAFAERHAAGQANLQEPPAVVASGGVQSLAFVEGALADGVAVTQLVRALCPTKVHRETYLEEKTEEELEEEKALREEQAANEAEAAAAQEEEELDEVADYDYQPPQLQVPQHAVPPPKVPANMKELTRFVAKRRDGSSVEALRIAKSPLAFITRSGGPAPAVAPPTEEENAPLTEQQEPPLTEAEEAMLQQTMQENADAVCDAPTAVEVLGKYLTNMFRAELEWSDDEKIRILKESDMAASEAEQVVVAEAAAAAAASAEEEEADASSAAADPVVFYAKPAPLRHLDLSDNALGAVFPQLAPALAQAASLRSLDLSGNGLGNPVAAMEELLPRGVGGDGPVGGDEAQPEDIAAGLEQLVKENKFLERLNLADNEITGEVAQRLLAALSESNTRAGTPPPEEQEQPNFEAFEDELPPPEFEGEDEVIPTESELDRAERAEEAEGDEGDGFGDDDGAAAASAADEDGAEGEDDEEGAAEEGEEGGDKEAAAAAAAAADEEEEEEELDEEQLAERERVRAEQEEAWREKMEERIWSLQRRQSERDEEKLRRAMMQTLIDDLVQLKNREIVMRKSALSQTERRSAKERERRSGFSRLQALDLSGNNIGSEGAAALAQAIRHEIPMTEDELAAAREAAGLPPAGASASGDVDDWGRDPDDDGDNGEEDQGAAADGGKRFVTVTKSRKVARSQMVWRKDDNDDDYEEAEEWEEDEEYEEEEEQEQEDQDQGAGAAGGDQEDDGGQKEQGEETKAEEPAVKTTKPGLKTMQALGLSRCHIGFKGLSAIAAVIGDNCPSLTALDLSNNPTCRKRIADPAETAERACMAEEQGLESADQLSGPDGSELLPVKQIVDRGWKSPGAVALAEAIAKNTTLRRLDLGYNFINPPSLTELATAGLERAQGSALETLVLDGNPLAPSANGTSSEGGLALFTLLLALTHTPVKRLSLDGCGVGACVRGATNVLAGLGVLAQQQLLELRLGNNQLGATQSFDERRCCCVILPDVMDQLRDALFNRRPPAAAGGGSPSRNSLEDETAAAAASADAASPSEDMPVLSLQVLALNDNHLTGSVSSHPLSDIVAASPDLLSLTVSGNPLLGRDDGLNRAFEQGNSGQSLQQLCAARCGLASADAVLPVLGRAGKTLQWLDLGDCQLSAPDMLAVFQAVAASPEMQRQLRYLSLWNADPSVDVQPLLDAAVAALSGGVPVGEEWAAAAASSASFTGLRQADFGVRPLGGKAQLPWKVASSESAASCAMSDIEFLLEKRRLAHATF